MLKNDTPTGQPNPIWFDLYNTYDINYGTLPKKYQTKFRQEQTLRQSLYRLTKKGLIAPILITQQNSPLPSPKAYGYLFYSLTLPGRLVAKNLPEKQTLTDPKDIEKTLTHLYNMGHNQVTLNQIRETLWTLTAKKFISQNEFDKHWNPTKLGLTLQNYAFCRERMGKYDGRRKYILRDRV
jgi:hypothetical protein